MKQIMKNKLFNTFLFILLIMLGMGFHHISKAACQTDKNIKMAIGETHQIQNTSGIVSWSSSKSGVASVNQNGVVTAVVANSSPVEIYRLLCRWY